MDDRCDPLSATEDCRRVIEFFLRTDAESLSLHELSMEVTSVHGRQERRRRHLHHCVLPKLAAAGIVEYDWSSRDVRFRADRAELRKRLAGAGVYLDVPSGLRN